MRRFFDFPDSLWRYFAEVDSRYAGCCDTQVIPADITCYNNLSHVKVVIWDVYGTLCGVDVGDLEGVVQSSINASNSGDGGCDDSAGNANSSGERLLRAARATIEEFKLGASLRKMFPSCVPEDALRELYLDMIANAHLESLSHGVEYPEVVIEQIWQAILQRCCQHGYIPLWDEPLRNTAYRCAYFFDSSLQRTWLYPYSFDCLWSLKKAGIVQGIISNAQFYTPIHLQRLFNQAVANSAGGADDNGSSSNNNAGNRRSTGSMGANGACKIDSGCKPAVELQDIFSEPLVLFSYEAGYSKPNKRSFQKLRNLLNNQGINSDEILYIGNDMLNDIWAAQSCNLKTMLYAGDASQTKLRTDEPRCKNIKPDAIATNMQQVQKFIIGK